MPDEVYNSMKEKLNEYIDKLKVSIPEALNDPDGFVDCSDKKDIASYVLAMVDSALYDSMFMTFDTFEEFGLLKKEV